MAGHRYAPRTDRNHAAVRDALRAAGFEVRDCGGVGAGWPDLAVAFLARFPGVARPVPFTVLLEVKDGGKAPSSRQLTIDQRTFFRSWPGAKAVVLTPTEAVDVCRHLKAGRVEVLAMEPYLSRLPQR